ncbi:bacteriohemerythrin [Acidiferrobacter sp.]|uniref:bacteriohemerythrin n=1 Tax=Acidiferrobacter sp. TaxID=1872107 RepID=UPI002605A4EC|nr:bacteriohemerythrin [Acidiferrobacter sp.]
MHWQWDPSLSVGINVIDNQHRRIVEYINELADAMERKDRTAVGGILDGMIDYTLTHVGFEESLMDRAGYPIAAEHKLVHQSFAKRMTDYKRRFNEGGDITRQLFSDLQMWLTNHIKRDDKDYSRAVRTVLEETGWIRKALSRFFG